MAYFIEKNHGLFANQLDQFATELPNYKIILGFTDDEVKEAVADAVFMKWLVKTDAIYEDHAHSMKAFLYQARNSKDTAVLTPPVAPAIEAMPALVKPGIQARFAQKANKAKAAAGATDTILKALGIFSQSSSTTNPADSPDLKVSIHAGYPELSFHLYGYQAVNIYKDGKLCKTMHSSPYTDKDLPAAGTTALVKYKAIYLNHDEETGTMSPEVSIAVEGK